MNKKAIKEACFTGFKQNKSADNISSTSGSVYCACSDKKGGVGGYLVHVI
jgi:hypothetical protein